MGWPDVVLEGRPNSPPQARAYRSNLPNAVYTVLKEILLRLLMNEKVN